MALKAKQGDPVFPKGKAKTKTLKAKEAELKGVHSHTGKEDLHITHLPNARDTAVPKAAWVSREGRPRRNKLDRYAISKFPQLPSQP